MSDPRTYLKEDWSLSENGYKFETSYNRNVKLLKVLLHTMTFAYCSTLIAVILSVVMRNPYRIILIIILMGLFCIRTAIDTVLSKIDETHQLIGIFQEKLREGLDHEQTQG